MAPLDPRPEAREEPTEEETLRREERARQPSLEEADAGPSGGNTTCNKRGHAEGAHDQAVDGRHGIVVEVLVARNGEGRIDQEEEAG